MPDAGDARLHAGRFLVASAVGLGVALSAPFTGEIRRWLRLTFPAHFVAIVGGAVAIAAVAALAWALLRIRKRRLARYGLIVIAAVAAIVYARWSALGNLDSDVVERVHFIEYGLVAWLFYRAWLPLGDVSILILTFLSATTVGTFEEWFQWFIPARVGEVRDVLLNSAAITCGILFSVAVRPPGRMARPGPQSLAHLAATTALTLAALAGFVDSAHVGHEIRDAGAGTFRSIYTADALRQLAGARQLEWATTPPLLRPARVSREDQYASEGLLHVQARNAAWTDGEAATAWHENLILEGYFAPVLDAPSYVSATGHRWTPAHREDAERSGQVGNTVSSFVSRAEGAFPIFVWPRTVFRTLSAACVVSLVVMALAVRRKRLTT